MDTLVLLKLLLRNLDQTPSGDQTATATDGQSQKVPTACFLWLSKRLYRLNLNAYHVLYQISTVFHKRWCGVLPRYTKTNSSNMLILCAISCQSTLPLIKHLNKRTWKKTTTFSAKMGCVSNCVLLIHGCISQLISHPFHAKCMTQEIS